MFIAWHYAFGTFCLLNSSTTLRSGFIRRLAPRLLLLPVATIVDHLVRLVYLAIARDHVLILRRVAPTIVCLLCYLSCLITLMIDGSLLGASDSFAIFDKCLG